MHTDPTNAARVRQEQTDAKTLTRSQNEYESITFEQCCEQVPNEAAVEAELEEHASLQHGHGHACRKPPRWPPRRPQHRPARPGGGPSVGTGPPEVRGAAGAAQVDVVYAFTDSMCLLEQLTCRSTKAEALYGERVTSLIDWRTSAMDSRASRLIWPSRTRWAVSSVVKRVVVWRLPKMGRSAKVKFSQMKTWSVTQTTSQRVPGQRQMRERPSGSMANRSQQVQGRAWQDKPIL